MTAGAEQIGRYERTMLFRSVGLFGFSDLLASEGISSPAEQIPSLCAFVVQSLTGGAIPYAEDRLEIEHWARSRLLAASRRWRRETPDFSAWHALAIKSALVVAWKPYQEFGELMCIRCGSEAFGRAANRLHKRGFATQLDALLDLRNDFVRLRLPKAIQTFDPLRGSGKEAEWLATVFYRFAIQALCSDRTNRSQLSEATLWASAQGYSPEEVLIQQEEEDAREALPDVFSRLEPFERQILSMYFGLDGSPQTTLAEIGNRYRISEYKAQNAVIVGLATLATALGVQGKLDDDEYQYARLLFIEGMDPASARRRLGLRKRDIHAKMTLKFRRALRAHTVHVPARRPYESEDRDMAKEQEHAAEIKRIRARIITELKRLRVPPQMGYRHDGATVAYLGGEEFALEMIYQVLDRDTIDELAKQKIPLNWLLSGGGPSDRPDLLEDIGFDRKLDHLWKRRWNIAETLYELCAEETRSERREEEKSHTIERIFRALTGIGQSVRRTLPLELRRKRHAAFRLYRVGENVLGSWEADKGKTQIAFPKLSFEIALRDGELEPEFARAFARHLTNGLLSGEVTLPGFDDAMDATGDQVTLGWQSAELEYALPN